MSHALPDTVRTTMVSPIVSVMTSWWLGAGASAPQATVTRESAMTQAAVAMPSAAPAGIGAARVVISAVFVMSGSWSPGSSKACGL